MLISDCLLGGWSPFQDASDQTGWSHLGWEPLLTPFTFHCYWVRIILGCLHFFACLLPRDEIHDGQKNISPMVVGWSFMASFQASITVCCHSIAPTPKGGWYCMAWPDETYNPKVANTPAFRMLGIFHLLRGWSSLAVTPCLPRAKCNNAFVGTPQGGCWVWVHVRWTKKKVNQTKESALQIHPVDFEGLVILNLLILTIPNSNIGNMVSCFFSCLYVCKITSCSALCVRAFYVDMFGVFSQSVRGSLDQISQFTNKDLSSNKPLGVERGSKQKTVYTHVNQLNIYIYDCTYLIYQM